VPSLSVLENLRLGELAASRAPLVRWRRERERARAALGRLGVEIDPAARVAGLSPVERALLAVVRAVEELRRAGAGGTGGVLVLDEPTVFLPRAETARLFGLLREVAAAGAGVLLVSHELAEVRGVADRATVLRDGRNVGTRAVAGVTEPELAELILGRPPEAAEPAERTVERGADVSVTALAGGPLRDVSLSLAAGSVVGLTGLAGSGYRDVGYLLFGARRAAAGRLRLGGASLDLAVLTPPRALADGIVLVPADRLRHGCVASLPVADNLALPVLGRLRGRIGLSPRRLARHARPLLERFGVTPAEPGLSYGALSGGNQQKALLAKWLQAAPRLLLLDSPTQGVDVGARRQILALVREAAAGGASVLYASDDHAELAAVCDRVLVLAGGRIAHEVAGAALSEETLGALTVGGDRAP
jgi:ribose transport system ATP-binding protein